MFVLCVAGEVLGKKHNIEIGFPGKPDLAHLVGHCESTFNAEARRLAQSAMTTAKRKPVDAHPSNPSFTIDLIKRFDDVLHRWVDVRNDGDVRDLRAWDQIYLFVEEGLQDDTQQVMPPPQPIRSPSEDGTSKERFFFLFHDLDLDGDGYLAREELQRVFNVMGIYEFTERQVDALFTQYDLNQDGVLSVSEFSRMMAAEGSMAELFLMRSNDYWDAVRYRSPSYIDASMITKEQARAIDTYLERINA